MQKNKQKNWAETIEQGLQVKDSDRTSVRKIMSRLRGQSESEEKDILSAKQIDSDSQPESKFPDSNERASDRTGSKITPVQKLHRTDTYIDKKLSFQEPSSPVQKLHRSNSHTGADSERTESSTTDTDTTIEPVSIIQNIEGEGVEVNTEKLFSNTGANSAPVQAAPVSNSTPVQKTNRLKNSQKSVQGGFLRVPNTILDNWIPRLSPTEAVVFLRIYRLSMGFNQRTCLVGTATLAKTCNISENTCRSALRRLIDLEMIRQLETINSKNLKGTTYEVCLLEDISDHLENVNERRFKNYTGVKTEPNKYIDHDDLKMTDHHHGETIISIVKLYEHLCRKPWSPADSKFLEQVKHIDNDRIELLMRMIHNRAVTAIGSFAYFAKAILAEETGPATSSRAVLKRKYEQFLKEIWSTHLGSNQWRPSEIVHLLKAKCLKEEISWNDDIANELMNC